MNSKETKIKKQDLENLNLDNFKDTLLFTSNFVHPSHWFSFYSSYLNSKEPLKLIEVGCREGRSSTWLIQNILKNPESKIYCLDLFPSLNPHIEQLFDHNINAINAWNKVEKIKGPSWKTLREITEYESFDLMYIDGWHAAHGVIEDAILGWKLLKVGGIMVFDDYGWGGKIEQGKTRTGIDSFMKIYKFFLEEIKSAQTQKAIIKTVENDLESKKCADMCNINFKGWK